jgi:hypothetical protein
MTTKLRVTAAIGLLTALGAAPALAAPTPTHSYEFSGNLADAFGGPAMTYAAGALNTFVGTGPAAGLHFAALQGPNVSGAFTDPGVYSMEMYFSLDNLDNYRRLVDFKDGTSDTGVYFKSGALAFYGENIVKPVGAAAGTLAHLVVTRDAQSTFSAYYNGAQVFAFNDTDNRTLLTGPNRIVRFFDDDGAEGAPGFVDFIRTYDVALSATDVAAAYNNGDPLRVTAPIPPGAVPEPGAWALMIAGFGGVGGVMRSRRVARPA